MSASSLTLTALADFPLVQAGDDLGAQIAASLRANAVVPADGDILVIAQKVVSKAEGRLVRLDSVTPSPRAVELAKMTRKDARLVELILSETDEIVKQKGELLIVAHRLGYVMANAGVDQSNVDHDDGEAALLLPVDADASAAALKARLDREFGVSFGVVINDSFGRPWREGVTGVALGAAGVPSLKDMIGAPDLFGRKMRVTEVAVADEIAAAASLLMGQGDEGRPVVHLRGFASDARPRPASDLLRRKSTDLFR